MKEVPSAEVGYAVYKKVASDAAKNVVWTFNEAGLIWLVGKVWLTGARIAFWAYLFFNAWSVLHVLFSTVAGVFSTVLVTGRPSGSKWLWAANAIRLVEEALSLVALWLAAKAVGYL